MTACLETPSAFREIVMERLVNSQSQQQHLLHAHLFILDNFDQPTSQPPRSASPPASQFQRLQKFLATHEVLILCLAFLAFYPPSILHSTMKEKRKEFRDKREEEVVFEEVVFEEVVFEEVVFEKEVEGTEES
ncbi:hypothetical protein BDZ45DRAFT_690452 [Acephala macrosclerotiorum]|nr:hypothetical protein BDZ45DRAFT_690452 [Acephala macrosclerotiorum]